MKRFLPLVLFSSCAIGGPMVTMDAFYEIDLSTKTTQVIAHLGKPYAIHHFDDGSIEYEYIERIKIGARDAEERHYFIMMKGGEVVSKRIEASIPLPYTFDSYEMQTTQQLDMDE